MKKGILIGVLITLVIIVGLVAVFAITPQGKEMIEKMSNQPSMAQNETENNEIGNKVDNTTNPVTNTSNEVIVKNDKIENIEALEKFLEDHNNKKASNVKITSYYLLVSEFYVELTNPEVIELSTNGKIITAKVKLTDDSIVDTIYGGSDPRAIWAKRNLNESNVKSFENTYTSIKPFFYGLQSGDGIGFGIYLYGEIDEVITSEPIRDSFPIVQIQISDEKVDNSYPTPEGNVTLEDVMYGNFKKRNTISNELFSKIKELVSKYGEDNV